LVSRSDPQGIRTEVELVVVVLGKEVVLVEVRKYFELVLVVVGKEVVLVLVLMVLRVPALAYHISVHNP
jgi:hypothetical protein